MNQTPQQKIAVDLLYSKHGKLYLDKEQAATELGVGRATIDRMRQTGEIKSSNIKGSIKFALTEIAKFIKN